jgi:hypothetical protein
MKETAEIRCGLPDIREFAPRGFIERLRNGRNRFQLMGIRNTSMQSSDPSPAPSPAAAVSELLKQAAATVYCRPALRALGAALPADDSLLTAALNEAAAGRDAKSFSHLYLGALFAGRRIPAEVLELGAALLPEAMLLLHTALRLEGDVAKSLAEAVRSGRMGSEREATAIIAGWLDYERREVSAPPEFLALTRKICRESVRTELHFVRSLLCLAAKLSGDPVVASILTADIERDRSLDPILAEARKCAAGPTWENTIPGSPVSEITLGSGATLKRAIPKAGRNDPCPCGSGRKFKQCCDGKLTAADQYQVDGVTVSEATAHPELLLTSRRIRELRSYELHALNPKLLVPQLAGEVSLRLARFREISRSIEVLQTVGPDQISINTIDEIAFEFYMAREIEALRWLVDWAPESVNLSFDMEVLLATPPERMQLLQLRARDAFEAERAGNPSAQTIFCDLGYAALAADPALGLLIARGVLPVCGWVNQSSLIELIEDTRDILGLDDNEPGHEILEATEQSSLDRARHAIDIEKVRAETTSRVSQRDAEIQRLKTQIDAMQATLTQRQNEIEKANAAPKEKTIVPTTVPAARDLSETRELRDHLRRLKDNLKVEHDERNRALRDLRAAQDQLRRATREKPENPSPENATDPGPDNEDSISIGVEWEPQSVRIPEYGAAFRESLRSHPRQASAAALAVAGRLAGGDPSIWKTVRALKMRPGTLRVRVAGDYRLLFEIGPADTLCLVDFILRRDLDRWLAASGR